MAPDEAPLEWRDAGEDELFEMANFYRVTPGCRQASTVKWCSSD